MTAPCDLCAATNIEVILRPFDAPLVNDFRGPGSAPAPLYPLGLMLCRSCGVLQLTNQLPPETVFPRDYAFRTGVTLEARTHAAEVAGRLRELVKGQGRLVLDVGANDGTLLDAVADAGLEGVGVEPTDAGAGSLQTILRLPWGGFAADAVLARHGRPAAITMLNVAAHMPALPAAFKLAADTLDEDGLLVVEVQRGESLICYRLFDTIYHEHRVYWTAPRLIEVVARVGFRVEALEPIDMHGGSWRLVARKSKWTGAVPDVLLVASLWCGLDVVGRRLASFADDIGAVISAIGRLADGQKLVALGAPSRGVTLVAACGLADRLVGVLEHPRSPKVGRVFPGTDVVVSPETEAAKYPRDATALILPWHLGDRMLRVAKQLGFRRALVPLPEPRLVELC